MTSSPFTDSTPTIRAFLGGSFDPVHEGHLQMAMSVYQQLAALLPPSYPSESQSKALHVSLLPNARSPFKQESSDPSHRLAMLKLALLNTPLEISEIELWQPPPVYTIDTVRALRGRYPRDILIFIMGADSAASLSRWKQGLELPHYAHLWVFTRQGSAVLEGRSIAELLPSTLRPFITHNVKALLSPIASIDSLTDNSAFEQPLTPTLTDLKWATNGRIYIDNTDIMAISSSQIRQHLQGVPEPAADASMNLGKVLPPMVYDYIRQHALYCCG
ncbi:MAG: nicotinate-nicotinamide nucleotide adenylyltransferase [Psychrobacter sp.]|nr:nicotinate-nicotinamide nucleotide adenylyltransferase [Psychrobacter sp.]